MNAAAVTSDMLKVPIGANHRFYGDSLDILCQRIFPSRGVIRPAHQDDVRDRAARYVALSCDDLTRTLLWRCTIARL